MQIIKIAADQTYLSEYHILCFEIFDSFQTTSIINFSGLLDNIPDSMPRTMEDVEQTIKCQTECPKFKTIKFCGLWKRYMAANQNLEMKSVLHLPSVILTSGNKSVLRDNVVQRKVSLNCHQPQTWSLYTRLKSLFRIPIPVVYCDSKYHL